MLTILSILITSCVTIKNNDEIILPPKPERTEIPEITNLYDMVNVINYYEHLVEEWELWAESVEQIIN